MKAYRTSFDLVKEFRLWCKGKNMRPSVIEKHVRAATGKGYDHVYAYFQVVMLSKEERYSLIE